MSASVPHSPFPMIPNRGKFITFEGIDGAGKSTHIGWVTDRIRAGGRAAIATREPGGTPVGVTATGCEIFTLSPAGKFHPTWG